MLPIKKIYPLIAVILFYFVNNITFAFTANERACASMFFSCAGDKAKSSTCKQMKKLMKDLKYSCNKVNKKGISKIFKCDDDADDIGQKNWLSVSWDISNPKIFGYCDSPNANVARKCAINKCNEKGGKNCKPFCDRKVGRKLRACRLGVQTYIASSTYGRFGCGTRWVKKGTYTVDGYVRRELNRCINRESKTRNVCEVEKVWK